MLCRTARSGERGLYLWHRRRGVAGPADSPSVNHAVLRSDRCVCRSVCLLGPISIQKSTLASLHHCVWRLVGGLDFVYVGICIRKWPATDRFSLGVLDSLAHTRNRSFRLWFTIR